MSERPFSSDQEEEEEEEEEEEGVEDEEEEEEQGRDRERLRQVSSAVSTLQEASPPSLLPHFPKSFQEKKMFYCVEKWSEKN